MAKITRFDPFGDLVRFDPFGSLEEFWRLPKARASWRGFPGELEIKVDVTEDDKAYRVTADVPGVKKEDIQVSIDGNEVAITAEARSEKEEKKGEKVIRSERYYGRQYRSFSLGHEIDQSKAEAKVQDGVLELVLPKKEGTAAQRLTVR